MSKLGQRKLLGLAAVVALILVAAAFGLRRRENGRGAIGKAAAEATTPPTEGGALRADFMYPVGAGRGSIEGRVLDNQNRPVPGAVVSVAPRLVGQVGFRAFRNQAPLALARADAQGRYRAENLAPGALSVVASAAPFVPARREPVDLAPNEHLTGVDLRLEGEGLRLHGSVTDSGGGGIAGARILAAAFDRESEGEPSVYLIQGVADETGKFELYLKSKTSYDLTVSADGYADDQAWIHLVTETRHDVRLHPAARISGRVLDSEGEPVAGAKVELNLEGMWMQRTAQPIVTDELGRYTSAGLDPGKYLAVARAGTKVSRQGDSVPLGLAEQRTLDLTLEEGLKIVGRVTNKAKQPIAGATIGLNTDRGMGDVDTKATTDAEGRYELGGMRGPVVFLMAESEGHGSKQTLLENFNDDRKDVDFVLFKSARLLVTVTDGEGRPIKGVMGAVEIETGEMPMSTTYRQGKTTSDAAGKFVMDNLPPGKMALMAYSQRGSRRQEGLVLGEGEDKQVTIKLDGEVSVAGTVVYEDETPAEGLMVVAFGKAGANHALTNKQGQFLIEKLSEGTFTVLINDQQNQKVFLKEKNDARSMTEVKLKAGERKEGIRLVKMRERSSIEGVVVNGKGQPVAGAQVGAIANNHAKYGGCAQAFGDKVLSDADGRFKVGDLPKGVFGVCAQHLGGAEALAADVPADTKNLQLVLKLPGSVAGVVVNSSGKPAADCQVMATLRQPEEESDELASMKGRPSRSQSDKQGAFVFQNLKPGVWDLIATGKDNARALSRHVVLESGATISGVRLQLSEGITVTGRLIHAETQAPLPDVNVTPAFGWANDSKTDSEGRYQIKNAQPGMKLSINFNPTTKGLLGDTLDAWVPHDATTFDVGTFALSPGDEEQHFMSTRPSAGLRVRNEGGHAVVTGIFEESAGHSSGVKVRDRVVAINGKGVDHLGKASIDLLLEGAEGESVTVKVQTANEAPREVVIPLTKF